MSVPYHHFHGIGIFKSIQMFRFFAQVNIYRFTKKLAQLSLMKTFKMESVPASNLTRSFSR